LQRVDLARGLVLLTQLPIFEQFLAVQFGPVQHARRGSFPSSTARFSMAMEALNSPYWVWKGGGACSANNMRMMMP